jgi:Fe-Mn family superoxide dismutase
MNKRDFLKTLSLIGFASVTKFSFAGNPPVFTGKQSLDNGFGGFKLPELGLGYDELEPHIDKRTMEIHYTKHHAAYVKNLNEATKGTELEGKDIESILSYVSPKDNALKNNGGGHYNHMLFWKILIPKSSKAPSGELLKAIETTFGSFDKFKELFSAEAKTRFGSGWAWLSVNSKKELFISSTQNQENPLMTKIVKEAGYPVLALDVWEHAYYLNYQNKRVDYISAFWNVVNWTEVEQRYLSAIQ